MSIISAIYKETNFGEIGSKSSADKFCFKHFNINFYYWNNKLI